MPSKVAISASNGRLRIGFRKPGDKKRSFLYLGLNDNAFNRAVAERARLQIEQDLITGNFDPTLNKYKDEGDRTENLPVAGLFDQYKAYKSDRISKRGLEKYGYTLNYLEQYFGARKLGGLTERDAQGFAQHLLENLDPLTAKQRLSLVKGCWEWAEEKQIVTGPNPWKHAHGDVKVPPKRRTEAYTYDIVQALIAGFSTSRYYSYYTDLIRFLFGCGPRFGEATALRWEHLSADCGRVWIGESYSRGHLGPTKTNEQREFDLPSSLKLMLQQRKPSGALETDLIFPAPAGGFQCDRSFRNRAWSKTVKAAGIDYKKPRITRSTFISHCSASGWNPADIAAVTGHDPETLIRHYLGGIQGHKAVPDIFGGADLETMDGRVAQRVIEQEFKPTGIEESQWMAV